MIVDTRFSRSRAATAGTIRYYQLRPRGPDEPPRQIFTRDGTVGREEARQMIDGSQAYRYLAHKMVFSPADGERPEDLRELTRHVMGELEHDKRAGLTWVAVEHHHTEHPHVHVLLAGGGDVGADKLKEVRIERGDLARMREDGADYCRLVNRVRDTWDRALERAEREGERELVPARGREVLAESAKTPPSRGGDRGR